MKAQTFAVLYFAGLFVFPPLTLAVVVWWAFAQLKGPQPRSLVPGFICFVLLFAVEALMAYLLLGAVGGHSSTSTLEFILIPLVWYGVPIGCFFYLWRSYGGTS